MKGAQAVRLDCPEREDFAANIRGCARLGLAMVRADEFAGRSCVIAAAGPSLLSPETLSLIAAAGRDEAWRVIALKDALGLLAARGLAPDLSVAMDGGAGQTGKIARLPNVTYYLASCCHPALFGHLAGLELRVFHSVCGIDGEAVLYRRLFPDGTMIGGGLTVANRAFALARYLGFADIVLAGCDFGWREDCFGRYAPGAVGRSKGETVRLRDRGRTDGREWFTRADLLISAVALAREIKRGQCRVVGDSLAAALARHDDATLDALVQTAPETSP